MAKYTAKSALQIQTDEPSSPSSRRRGDAGSSHSPLSRSASSPLSRTASTDWRKHSSSFRVGNKSTSREIMRRAASGLDNFLSSSPKILNGSEEENEELEEEDFVDSSKMYVRIDELLDLLPPAQAASFRASVRPRRFLAGSEIVGHGHDSASLFFITAGSCQVTHDHHSAVLGQGVFFGEESVVKAWALALCPPSKLQTSLWSQEEALNPLLGWHSNLVRAKTDCTVMEIPAAKAFEVLHRNAQAWSLLLAVSAARNEIKTIPIPIF